MIYLFLQGDNLIVTNGFIKLINKAFYIINKLFTFEVVSRTRNDIVLKVICYFLCLTTFRDSKALELSRLEIVITSVSLKR